MDDNNDTNMLGKVKGTETKQYESFQSGVNKRNYRDLVNLDSNFKLDEMIRFRFRKIRMSEFEQKSVNSCLLW